VFGKQLGFWLAVAGVSVITGPVINLAADSKLGELVPGLRTLNAYDKRKNG
jgi:hypothetical protein